MKKGCMGGMCAGTEVCVRDRTLTSCSDATEIDEERTSDFWGVESISLTELLWRRERNDRTSKCVCLCTGRVVLISSVSMLVLCPDVFLSSNTCVFHVLTSVLINEYQYLNNTCTNSHT